MPAPARSSAAVWDAVVARDGSGGFSTVQAAIDAAPTGSAKPYVIFIKPGTYREKIVVPSDKPFLSLAGKPGDEPILAYGDYAREIGADGKPLGTGRTASVSIQAHDFSATNLVFENTSGPHASVGQAIAVAVDADRCVFDHCVFHGEQDTLYANGGRQLYKDCTLSGCVDFIFGNAAAVFDHCNIVSTDPGCITAQSRTAPDQPTGYVFLGCRLIGSAPKASVHLGRPWRPYARVVYLDCDMGPQIAPEGWDDWRDPAKRATAFYAEFGSTGPGADLAARASWSHALSLAEARAYLPRTFLAGSDGFDPDPQADLESSSEDNSGAAEPQPAVSTTGTSDAIAPPRIPNRTFSITRFGAVGNAITLDTKAIQAAVDACGKAGGGIVDVPAGRYLTGPITLASKIDLRLDRGATLLMTQDTSQYALDNGRYQNDISCDNCIDVAITGAGTIDGQGRTWWDRFDDQRHAPPGSPKPQHRPYLIVITSCARVLVQGVILANSPSFHLVPGHCRDVRIEDVTITAPPNSPNTDGIDPSGWNFLIDRCTIDVGDDNIAIKPSGSAPLSIGGATDSRQASCKNFLIRDCTFLHGHGMSIGGQTPGGLDGLTVTNCVFRGTHSGIRLKAARGSGGLVQDLDYNHLSMTDVRVPIDMSSYYFSMPAGGPATDSAQPVTATTPIWRNIAISDVTATGADTDISVVGLPEMPFSSIAMNRVDLRGKHAGEIVHAKNVLMTDCAISSDDAIPLQTVDADVIQDAGKSPARGYRAGKRLDSPQPK
jgi:pectin methylesterase-like acyl-CoA thioesterase